jgi:hypothetical protein
MLISSPPRLEPLNGPHKTLIQMRMMKASSEGCTKPSCPSYQHPRSPCKNAYLLMASTALGEDIREARLEHIAAG